MKKLIITAASLFFIFVSVVPASAEPVIYDPFTIEGTHSISGAEDLSSMNNTFVLTAKGDAPMPESSEVISPANSSFSFGSIQAIKPGIYEYTVSREINRSKNITFDDSVYHVYVTVFSDGTNAVVLEKEGVKAKPDKITYEDKYTSPQNVKTGDTMEIFTAAGIFFPAAVFLMLLLKKRRD